MKQIISRCFSLWIGRTHDLLARGVVLCYINSFDMFKLFVFVVDVSHSGHHDSLVRGIVICYTKSFHLLNLLFLLLAVSHSGHQDSLVRGNVICYTKSVATPHGGRVVCPPVARGRAMC
jgi:hypothetical protein